MELLYKRSTSARARQLQMARNDNFKAQHWIYLCTYSSVRTCAAITSSRVPAALSNLSYRRAFNALPWIIYTQIEMSHSCRSGCLSAPFSLLYSAPFVLSIGFTFYQSLQYVSDFLQRHTDGAAVSEWTAFDWFQIYSCCLRYCLPAL